MFLELLIEISLHEEEEDKINVPGTKPTRIVFLGAAMLSIYYTVLSSSQLKWQRESPSDDDAGSSPPFGMRRYA